jgi:DNA-binding MarR family transcriptional regulator
VNANIEKHIQLRKWIYLHLPIEDSFIAYDLILIIANSFANSDQLTVKQLFSSLPHSYSAIRAHYMRLIDKGLIEHEIYSEDKRVKYVKPSQKLVELFFDFEKATNEILKIAKA